MSNWEDFEVDCTNYLNKNFNNYAKFIHKGGSDSTTPDIFVETNNKNFYIEAKHSPAQCGQFVLIPNIQTSSFEYSKKNIVKLNIYSKTIMEYMNNYFDEFREAGTAGKDINIPNSSNIFSNWIINAYKEKGIKFIITNDYVILPIEKFNNYFYVSAKYRIKRSGSSSVGANKVHSILNYINSCNYNINDFRIDNSKLFITSNECLHNKRFIFQQYEYMFSQRNDEFEIRKLSNTYNANVIFSIHKKDCVSGLSNDEFIKFLS